MDVKMSILKQRIYDFNKHFFSSILQIPLNIKQQYDYGSNQLIFSKYENEKTKNNTHKINLANTEA